MTVEGRRVLFKTLLLALHLYYAFHCLFVYELAIDPLVEYEAHELLKIFPVEAEIEVFVWVQIDILNHPLHLLLHFFLLILVPFDLGGQEPIIDVVLYLAFAVFGKQPYSQFSFLWWLGALICLLAFALPLFARDLFLLNLLFFT